MYSEWQSEAKPNATTKNTRVKSLQIVYYLLYTYPTYTLLAYLCFFSHSIWCVVPFDRRICHAFRSCLLWMLTHIVFHSIHVPNICCLSFPRFHFSQCVLSGLFLCVYVRLCFRFLFRLSFFFKCLSFFCWALPYLQQAACSMLPPQNSYSDHTHIYIYISYRIAHNAVSFNARCAISQRVSDDCTWLSDEKWIRILNIVFHLYRQMPFGMPIHILI